MCVSSAILLASLSKATTSNIPEPPFFCAFSFVTFFTACNASFAVILYWSIIRAILPNALGAANDVPSIDIPSLYDKCDISVVVTHL